MLFFLHLFFRIKMRKVICFKKYKKNEMSFIYLLQHIGVDSVCQRTCVEIIVTYRVSLFRKSFSYIKE